MDYLHHVPDKIVKLTLGKSQPIAELGTFKPDWAIKRDKQIICIEYENSSGGCLQRCAKYSLQANIHNDYQFLIILIRSINHQNKHRDDFELAKHIATINPTDNLNIVFKNCTGYTKDLLAIKDSI